MAGSSPADVREFAWIDDAVPRYRSFYGLDDHRRRDKTLAAEHDHVTLESFGESADGEDLWAVTVGEGSRTALMFATPHPNEPIGCMTLDFLVEELATNDELRESLDYEFVCVRVIDPDGLRRNEGWFDGPFTLANYALNFYRPPPDEQVEGNLPVELPEYDYSFDDPSPEAAALADLIEDCRPEFIYSFHNAAFGGCYYYLSEPLEPIHGTLQAIPREYGVPLHLGEPEGAQFDEFDDAVFRYPTAEDRYEDFEWPDDEGPTEFVRGANAVEYADRFTDDAFELVVELPYFYDPAIEDETELDRSREAVIREGVAEKRELLEAMRAALSGAREHLADTSMAREATGVIDYFDDEYDAKLEWAESTEETDAPATVAQAVDASTISRYFLLTYAGMALRSLDRAAMAAEGEARAELVAAKRSLEETFHEHVGVMQERLDYEAIPIWKLVAIQARAGLICLDYRQGANGA